MEDVVKVEVGDDTSVSNESIQQFALLLILRMTQLNGIPLQVGRFTGWVISQMLHEISGVVPKEVLVMNDQEEVMEFEEVTPMIEASQAVHGLFHWGTVP